MASLPAHLCSVPAWYQFGLLWGILGVLKVFLHGTSPHPDTLMGYDLANRKGGAADLG